MLTSLFVENIALIKRLEIDLSSGFTVLTGETGAGKSILIDSISLLMGNKSNRELIRTGEEKATVSGIFSCDEETVKLIEEMGISFDGDSTLCLQRTLYADGRSTTKINGRTYPLSFQRSIGRSLINIHGQHDTKLLLDSASHTDLIDSYSESEPFLKAYQTEYRILASLRSEIKTLQKNESEKETLTLLLEKQIEEIKSARLKEGEEEELLSQRTILANAEKISRQVKTIVHSLYRNEKGVHATSLIDKALEAVDRIKETQPSFADYADKLTKMKYDLEDLCMSAESLLPDTDGDPAHLLNEIEDKLDTIARLKKKYGDTVADILAFKADAEKKLANVNNNASLLEEKKREFKKHAALLKEKADALSACRKGGAERLEKAVLESLSFLDMPKVRFSVSFGDNGGHYAENGGDVIEFLLSANPGEPLKPMAKTASGGELSRVMLALKSAFREKDKTPTLIFDEVDNGVSGKTAQKIGIKLKQIASTSQVLCVTHSAQIASLADHHYKIAKSEENSRTETHLQLLGKDERIGEIARIIGGQEITDTIRQTARELIEQSISIL